LYNFDLTKFKTELLKYSDSFNLWYDYTKSNLAIGALVIAQRELPVHIVNEYCRLERHYLYHRNITHDFNEEALPRDLTFFSWGKNATRNDDLFDLKAITSLDDTRTEDITHLRENLSTQYWMQLGFK
jgi:hypothetical protein